MQYVPKVLYQDCILLLQMALHDRVGASHSLHAWKTQRCLTLAVQVS
jgi:hypothetical protein